MNITRNIPMFGESSAFIIKVRWLGVGRTAEPSQKITALYGIVLQNE